MLVITGTLEKQQLDIPKNGFAGGGQQLLLSFLSVPYRSLQKIQKMGTIIWKVGYDHRRASTQDYHQLCFFRQGETGLLDPYKIIFSS